MESSSVNRLAETDVSGHREISQMFGDGQGDHNITSTLTQINRRYNIDELFPIFLGYLPCIPSKTISPSCFMQEMQLTTEERFQKLTYPLRRFYPTLSGIPHQEPKAFKPSPSIVIFQNYEIGQVYTVTLSVRNVVAVMRGIRMHCEYSPIFTVVQNSPIVYSKVAPGMTVNFTVTFKPLDKFEDCSHRIAFETEEEAFIIPIIALGPRPLLDFPDRVDLPTSLVKIQTNKLLFVRNIGIIPAVFTTATNSKLFSVNPAKGVIGPKDTLQIAIKFESQVVGTFDGYMTIRYETGEELFVTLHASAENGKIHLDKTFVGFEKTYMGLQRQQTITLENNTDHIIKYSWKRFAIPATENAQIEKLKESFQEIKEFETVRTTMLEWYAVIDSEANKLVYDRIYDEEVDTLQDEQFPFRAPVFTISPLTGEVWPHGTMSMYITFEPQKMQEYAAVAFCEVTGHQQRLRLRIEGAGKGPLMKLNVTTLDIDYIFLCSRHSYEIIVQNNGDIPGRVDFKPKECVFGGRAHCSPHHLHILPGEHQTFVVSFSSNCQGYFFETIDFVIHESKEIISCLLKGKVISPTLHFNLTMMDFKEIPIGFVCNRYVVLTNSSMVPVNFTLRVMYDGSTPSISYKTYANMAMKPILPSHPKEFTITPNEGVVTAYSFIKIHLALTPNLPRNYSTALIVDMWDSKAKSVSLPLKFSAKCPRIVCTPKEIVIRFCFINFPYARVVTFENHSLLPGFFYIVPQNDAIPSPMTYTTPITQGIIKPKSTMNIPLTIMTKELGKHVVNVNVIMLGDSQPQQLCKLMCTGQGPVISVTSYSLHWEETEVLKTKVMVVNLTNDSPIPATYTPVILNPLSPWSVSTESGVLYAEETIALEVSLYLTDTGNYSGILEVNVENSRTINIELTAIGIGTSIVLDPPMCPIYNLGSVFRHQLIRREILVTNKGQKHHQLIWTSAAEEAASKRRKSTDPKTNAKATIFQMKPVKMMLKGGESTTLIFEGQCEELRCFEDTIICCAIIEKKGKKKVILTSNMKVTFIDPMIKWNMDSILFRVDYKPGNELFEILQQKVCLKNMAADLPITVTLETDYPFLLATEGTDIDYNNAQLNSLTLYMEGQTCSAIIVLFDPSHQTASRREICRGEIVLSYKDHPQTDSIPISAEVNFPNVKVQPSLLDFGCTLIGGEKCKQILLINTSPLTVNYWWFWKYETIRIKFRPPYTVAEHMDIFSSETIQSSESEIYHDSFEDIVFKVNSKARNKDGSSLLIPAGIQFSVDKLRRIDSLTSKLSNSQIKIPAESTVKKTKKSQIDAHRSKSATVRVSTENDYEDTESMHAIQCGFQPTDDKSTEQAKSASIDVNSTESNQPLSEEFTELRNRCWPLVQQFYEANRITPLFKKLPSKQKILPIEEVFQITPSFGRLKPFESQLVSVSFNARSCVSAEVSALCFVEGGPVERVSMIGFSGTSGYILDRTHIDFGRRMFCEICEEELVIHNSGNLPLDFLANTMDVPEDMKAVHEKGCLIVNPKSGTLKADIGVKLHVNYFPGIPGWFSKSFELEVGCNYPITITIEGYAVIPQLYVWLPRPNWLTDNNSNPEDYNVIADMQHTTIQKKHHKRVKYSRQPVEYLQLSEEEKHLLEQDNWVAVSYLDEFPSVAEIELAIERHQAYTHICAHPSVISKFRTTAKSQCKGESIPGLTAMPCLIDFGLVVINTAVSFSAILENLGSIPVEAKIPLSEKLENDHGICINFRDVRLAPEETASIHLTFQPTIEDYPLKRQQLNRTIFVWVTSGARIPFEVRATVILPFVTISPNTVNFEQVLCSHCKMIKICVENNGWADCTWSAKLSGENKRSISSSSQQEKKKDVDLRASMLTAFTIREASGMLKPGTHTHVEIFFQPVMNGLHKHTIEVVVDHNPETLRIKLIGEGLLPNLILSSNIVTFESCLPYPEHYDEVITLENPCSFPIEFFFPDFDSQIEHEDRLLRLLCHYYNMDELFIPIRKPGDLLPKELYDFNQIMIDQVNYKLLQEHMKHEQGSITTLMQSHSVTERIFSGPRKRSSTIGPKARKPTSSVFSLARDVGRPSSITRSQTTSTVAETIDTKSPDDIEAAIHEYISDLRLAYNNEPALFMDQDPIKVCLQNALDPIPPIDTAIPKNGVFIVFHGAPNTDYLLAAHRAARALSLAVVNIDQMILDSIVSSTSQNALKAKRLINQVYNEQQGISLLEESAADVDNLSDFEKFYIWKDKVDTLYLNSKSKMDKPSKKDLKNKSSTKTQKGSSGKSSSKKSSKKSVKTASSKTKSKTSKADSSSGILGDLPPDLIIELIKERLQHIDCLEGAVVDGLDSIFFHYNGTRALIMLLKAVGNLKYIHFVTFFNSYATHLNALMKEKTEKDKRALAEQEAKIAYLENLSDDEMLPEEDKVLYRELKLKLRRARQKQRREQEIARQKRMKEKNAHGQKSQTLKKGLPETKAPTRTVSDVDKKSPKPKSGGKSATSKSSDGTSTIDSKSKGKDKKSSKTGFSDLQTKFQCYQNEYDELVPMLEYWDRVTMEVVGLPQPVTVASKKGLGKKGKKSATATSTSTTQTKTPSVPAPAVTDLSPESQTLRQALKGVPVWVIDARVPGSDKVKIVLDALLDTEEINSARPSGKEQVREESQVLNFLSLTKPMNRMKMESNINFALSLLPNPVSSEDLEEVLLETETDLQSDSKGNIEYSESSHYPQKLDSKGTVAVRESTVQQKKTASCEETGSVGSSVMEVSKDNVDGFKSRWVLQPGEKVFWNIRFQPSSVGEYSHPYTFNLVDCNTSYTFEARGFCDIPKIYMDPYYMFPKIELEKRGEKFYLPTYFLNKAVLDFGPVLIPKPDEIRLLKSRTIETSINLLNCSTLPVECSIFYLEDSAVTEHFSFTPSQLVIEPGTLETVALTASPTHIGKNTETIGLSIKDNPHIEFIKLVCYGILSEFEIEPRMINFEHILLYRIESRSITLTNKCLVSLSWKFLDIEDFTDDIKISETFGVIKPLENKIVTFTYEAKVVQQIDNKRIRVEVYEAEARAFREPVISDVILISAETCDVMVDIKFHHSDDKHVKFGDVKVGKKYAQPMQIINTGKYDLHFIIEPVTTDVGIPNRESTLWVEPESTIVPSGEVPVGVQVFFKPDVQLDLHHALFKCVFYDTYNRNVVVGIIPITVSGRSFYSEYKVEPVPDINFGAMLLGTRKEAKLNIQNTGPFFLTYKISTTKEVEEKKPKGKSRGSSGKSDSSGNEKKGSAKKSPTPSSKEKPMKSGKASTTAATAKVSKGSTKAGKSKKAPATTTLQLGPFTIQEPQGTVEPGEAAVICISCYANAKGELDEEIRVTISEDNPMNNPCLIKLSAVGAVPFIDFNNVERIFAEHYICENLGAIDVPDEVESHGVYIKDCSKLKLCRVLIGTQFIARLKLYNSGLVPYDLNTSMTDQSAFSVKPSKFSIAPLTMEIVSITFAPNRLQVYNAVLEIGADLSHTGNKLTVYLEGEGITPQVAIVSPLIRDSEGRTLLVYRPTAVGHSSSKQIIIKNTGIVACKMIIELYNNQDGLFTMCSTQDADPFFPESGKDSPRHTTVTNLAPAQSDTFIFKFKPNVSGEQNAEVRIFVMHNLYENETVMLSAEGYVEDITLDATDANALLVDKEDDLEPPPYHIDFGQRYVNYMTKRFMKITNNSEKDIYRFEWASGPHIDICPSVGHIRPRMSKETRIVFIPREPVKLDKLEILCEISQIAYYDNESAYSWDDKIFQDIVSSPNTSEEEFDRKSSEEESLNQTLSEPMYQQVSGTTRTITLAVSGESSYADFECSAEQVDFNDTFMFQRKTRSFKLTNVGNIFINYYWSTDTVDLYPLPDENEKTAHATAESLLSAHSRHQTASRELQRSTSSHSTDSDSELNTIQNTVQLAECGSRVSSARVLSTNQKKPKAKLRPQTAQNQTSRGIVARTASALTGFLADLSAKSDERFCRAKCVRQRSWQSVDYNPYTLEPMRGRLEPGETVEIKLMFSPLDLGNYRGKISCKIPNLSPHQKPLIVSAIGCCLLPMAHFEIGESDYVISGRRHNYLVSTESKDLCSNISVDSDTRVIEFNVLGVGVMFSRKFKLINPTNRSYNFLWRKPHMPTSSSVSPFYCASPEGRVQKGKHFEIEFCFVPPDVGTFESFWTFSILEHGIEIMFLLVGTAAYPAVRFRCPHLQLPGTIMGATVERTVSLVSKADSQLEFSIVPDSLFSEGHFQNLEVTPEKGFVAAGDEKELSISFTPTIAGTASFKLKCVVEKVSAPLVLLVEVLTFRVQPTMFYEPVGQKRVALDHSQSNVIDLGVVTAKYPQTLRFHVGNIGKVSFFYQWNFDTSLAETKKVNIAIQNECGQITHESKVVSTLAVTLLSKSILKDFPISLEIIRGPTYNLLLQATASQPAYAFSFSQYDFGPCFIQRDQVCRYAIKLGFINNDASDLSLECAFTKKPHLAVIVPRKPISSKSCTNLVIKFYPLARCKYSEMLVFVINGVHQKKVTISGEGIDAMVHLVNPRDKMVNLGNLHVGKRSRRLIPVINKARSPIQVKFSLCQLPGSHTGSAPLEEFVKLVPSTAVMLKPNLAIDLAIKFSPLSRMQPLNAKVCMEIVDRTEPLLVVNGSCLGAEFSLNRAYLPFGAVVQGCSLEMKVKLVNSGDLGAKFDWKADEWDNENFSILPTSGYCSPGQEVTFVISFHPQQIQLVIRDEVKCHVENYGSLSLIITGSGVSKPPPKETINFVTPVRQRMKKILPITNKSTQLWKLTPVLTGDYFSGADLITIAPLTTSNYEVVYFPLRMSKVDGKHKGSVFLQLPDGQALVYDLLGTAEIPLVSTKISRRILVKTQHNEVLSVMNWLPSPQRFRVETELGKNEKLDRPYDLDGNDFLDVPGLTMRKYQLGLYLYKEGDISFKVTFTNPETSEFQFQELTFTAIKRGPLDVIKLVTCVRCTVSHDIRVDNPLSRSVNFAVITSAAYLAYPTQRSALPGASEIVTLEYCPLQPGQSVNYLELVSADLGVYPYEVHLTAKPAPSQKPTSFTALLGQNSVASVVVLNLAKVATEFRCSINSDQFMTDQRLSLPVASEGSLSIFYEPTAIGTLQAELTVTSSEAGEYIFPLFGNCMIPKPQGPFIIRAGSRLLIPFKNIFLEQKTFHMHSDLPAFTLKDSSETFEAKAEKNIAIGMKSLASLEMKDRRFPVTGKLVVTCSDPALADIKWTYYLKGVL